MTNDLDSKFMIGLAESNIPLETEIQRLQMASCAVLLSHLRTFRDNKELSTRQKKVYELSVFKSIAEQMFMPFMRILMTQVSKDTLAICIPKLIDDMLNAGVQAQARDSASVGFLINISSVINPNEVELIAQIETTTKLVDELILLFIKEFGEGKYNDKPQNGKDRPSTAH